MSTQSDRYISELYNRKPRLHNQGELACITTAVIDLRDKRTIRKMTMNLYSNSTHDLSDKSEVQSKFSRRLVGKAQPLNRTTPSSLFSVRLLP